MNEPRDNGFSKPPGGAAPGTGDGGQPRKPRIEVLQRSPAAAPAAGPARGAPGGGFGGATAAAPKAAPLGASWVGPNPPHAGEASDARRRGGPARSRTSLLMLLALIVIAAFLLYTYLSSERGAEYPDKASDLASADADLLGNPDADSEAAPAEASDEPAPEPAPAPSGATAAAPERAAPRAAAPEAPPAEAVDESEEPAVADAGAGATVRAFYSALSAGDGASAAQLVIPAKRRSGPLSAGALSRYYSSFRRPLRLRSVTPVDAGTVRVAYDYVLADGRTCRGQAAVDVVQAGGRSLVSGIRTRGPC
jgi:hypothetical protein